MIVQPALMHYRVPIYEAIASQARVTLVCDDHREFATTQSFDTRRLWTGAWHGFRWQSGLLAIVRRERPDAIWLVADVNYVSSLVLLLMCRLLKIPVVLHGQGVVKVSRSAGLRKLVLRMWVSLASKYVAYADICASSMIADGFPERKLEVISNRFETADAANSSNAIADGQSVDILFVGRLREKSEIGLLIDAMKLTNDEASDPVRLHIVGDGGERPAMQRNSQGFEWIHWHGEINDDDLIREIAKSCAVGVYPGAAGLSVLTYMKLSLAVVVGDDLSRHMGPEPSYVVDGYNGWTFRFGDVQDLAKTLEKAVRSPKLTTVRENARATYLNLHAVPYSEEMLRVLNSQIDFNDQDAEVAPPRYE